MKTTIGWTQFTINFWWGCTKVSPACKNCYAAALGLFFGRKLFGQPVLWGPGQPRQERLQAARAEALALQRQAVKKGERYRVFVNSMSDWLDEDRPFAWLLFLLETIYLCPNLDFQLLSKRPHNFLLHVTECMRMAYGYPVNEHAPFAVWLDEWLTGKPPPNVWIGCTAEDQEWAGKRIPHLLNIPAKVRFLSCEPLSGPLDLSYGFKTGVHCPDCGGTGALDDDHPDHGKQTGDCEDDDDCLTCWRGGYPQIVRGLHWIIAGGESGTKATPADPRWFRALQAQCAAAGVPFFFKQWGEWLPKDHVEAAHTAAVESGIPYTVPRRGDKGQKLPDGTLMLRVGTAVAGNLLDGRKWEELPKP